MEFGGEGAHNLSINDRMVLCNLCVEAGAKTGIVEPDLKVIEYVHSRGRKVEHMYISDQDAVFEKVYHYDLSKIKPVVARPDFVDDVVPLEQLGKVKIDQAFLGSCNNGRIDDLRVAARLLKNKKVKDNVRFIVAPASNEVYLQALEEGIITPEDTVNCTGVYTYFDQVIEGNTFHPTCLGVHGQLSVSEALTRSCNIFFYDVGRRLGIDTINRYASLMGLGEETGLELGSAVGTLSSPEHTKEMGGTWTQGNVVQASIGQMDTMVSPLQLSVQAMTLANRGDRYKVYLVDEVRSFDGSELLEKTEPELVSSFDMSEEIFDAVVNGMIGVGMQYTAPEYMLSEEDAEIVIGIMLEEGVGASRLIRQILLAWEEYVR